MKGWTDCGTTAISRSRAIGLAIGVHEPCPEGAKCPDRRLYVTQTASHKGKWERSDLREKVCALVRIAAADTYYTLTAS